MLLAEEVLVGSFLSLPLQTAFQCLIHEVLPFDDLLRVVETLYFDFRLSIIDVVGVAIQRIVILHHQLVYSIFVGCRSTVIPLAFLLRGCFAVDLVIFLIFLFLLTFIVLSLSLYNF